MIIEVLAMVSLNFLMPARLSFAQTEQCKNVVINRILLMARNIFDVVSTMSRFVLICFLSNQEQIYRLPKLSTLVRFDYKFDHLILIISFIDNM